MGEGQREEAVGPREDKLLEMLFMIRANNELQNSFLMGVKRIQRLMYADPMEYLGVVLPSYPTMWMGDEPPTLSPPRMVIPPRFSRGLSARELELIRTLWEEYQATR